MFWRLQGHLKEVIGILEEGSNNGVGDWWRDWWLRLIKTMPANWCKWWNTCLAVPANGVKVSKEKGLSSHQPKWASHDNLHLSVKSIGQPCWTAAVCAVLPSPLWWGWWPSTTSRCPHQMCWVSHHPLVGWQWGHLQGCAATEPSLPLYQWVSHFGAWSMVASLI